MIALYYHAAGTEWTEGAAITYENLSMSVSAGCVAPELSFATNATLRERDHLTLVADGKPVETVFVIMTISGAELANEPVSVSAEGIIATLDEIVRVGSNPVGWPTTSLDTLAFAAKSEVSARPGYIQQTGVTDTSFDATSIDYTRGNGDPLAPSAETFDDDLQSLLSALSRYAPANNAPLDWRMNTNRQLLVASPIRRGRSNATYQHGRNCELAGLADASVGRVASRVIVGNAAQNTHADIPSRFGDIDTVTSSGYAGAILNALTAGLRTYSISVEGRDARIENGRPMLWIGDTPQVVTRDGSLALTLCTDVSLTIDEIGNVSISGTLREIIDNDTPSVLVNRVAGRAPAAALAIQQRVSRLEQDTHVDLLNDQTIAGVKTFSAIPILPATNPVSDDEAARKAYVDERSAYDFCRINRNSSQSVSEASSTLIAPQTVDGSNWQSGGILTIPKTGWYRVSGSLAFRSHATLNSYVNASIIDGSGLLIASSTAYNLAGRTTPATHPVHAAICTIPNRIQYFTQGETIGLYAYALRTGAGSGGTFTVESIGGARLSYWQAEWIGEDLTAL